jgi:hypothetical protein
LKDNAPARSGKAQLTIIHRDWTEPGAATPRRLQIPPLRSDRDDKGSVVTFRNIGDWDGQCHELLLAGIELALYEVSYLASSEVVAFEVYGELTPAVDDDSAE